VGALGQRLRAGEGAGDLVPYCEARLARMITAAAAAAVAGLPGPALAVSAAPALPGL